MYKFTTILFIGVILIAIIYNVNNAKCLEKNYNLSLIEKYVSSNHSNYEIVHYSIGQFPTSFGGVARYDHHISMAFPNRKWFKGPDEKDKMLTHLESINDKHIIVITDNHLSLDIPNKYFVILVHHGCAKTHMLRDLQWTGSLAELCVKGQEEMFVFRDPKKTLVLSCSTWCIEEFTKHSKDYANFQKKLILHTSELNPKIYKTSFNSSPIIIGNWSSYNKGNHLIPDLKRLLPEFTFIKVSTKNNTNIDEHNKELNDIYMSADIFLQLSLAEGNSYATLDAFNKNLLICGTNVGLLYKDIPQDTFVSIDWEKRDDTTLIANKIRYLWENKEKYKNKSKKWFDENCRFFYWENKMKDLINKFHDIMLKKTIIVIYSLPRTGTHLAINTISQNLDLGSNCKVINLDIIDNISDFLKTSTHEILIFKTHEYNNLLSLLDIQKDNVYIISPNTPYKQGCISYLNFISSYSNSIYNLNKQLKIVSERYINFIQFHKNYNHLNNLYNTIMIHRKYYENHENYLKVVYLLSKFLNLKILNKDNIIFYDEEKFNNNNLLQPVQVLNKYELKIYNDTIAKINNLNDKDNIQLLNKNGFEIDSIRNKSILE